MSEIERVAAWADTSVGRVREHNEDAYLIDPERALFAVADGMGGHAAGEVASRIAIETMFAVMRGGDERIAQLEQHPSDKVAARAVQRLLEDAVLSACAAVHDAGQIDPTRRGMGTTLDVLLVVASQAFVAHVGDSRVYLVRGDKSHQLTQDHNLANELLKRGKMTAEQVAQVKQKNALVRAIGVNPSVEVDTLRLDVLAGDRFLLCSDGLHAYLQRDELVSVLRDDTEQAAARLVALANQRGGHDNITALVVSTGDVGSERQQLAKLKLETLRAATLFRFLNYQELVKVASVTDVRLCAPHAVIFDEGTEGDTLFVVLSGRVRVQKGDTAIVELGPGEHFGEMALIDRAPRSASVSTLEETRLLAMKRRDFLGIVKHDRETGVKLLWQFLGVLSSRLRDTSRELDAARGQLASEPTYLDLDDEDIESLP